MLWPCTDTGGMHIQQEGNVEVWILLEKKYKGSFARNSQVLSLYQQDLLKTRLLPLLLQICTLAFDVVSFASLSVFPLLHTFFPFSPHIAQDTRLSTESIPAPRLEVDCFSRHCYPAAQLTVSHCAQPLSRDTSPNTGTFSPCPNLKRRVAAFSSGNLMV